MDRGNNKGVNMAKYKVTQEEYNLLQKEYRRLGEMLENVEIIKPQTQWAQLSPVCGMLDLRKASILLQEKANKVWYYNFDNNTWIMNNLVQDGFFHRRYNTTNVQAFKRVVEEENKNLEVAGCVVMPVDWQKCGVGVGTLTSNPVFMKDGTGAVATLLCRDRVSGQFIKPVHWIGIDNYVSQWQCMQGAMSKFAVTGALDYYFRQRLVEKYK